MIILQTIADLRSFRSKCQNQTLGLVPTMGCLHEGHLSLVDQAKKDNDLVVMSLFVNPFQFGPQEDFHRYPRPWEQDQILARERGVDLLFCPDLRELYPSYPPSTVVEAGPLGMHLCGHQRPGHFTGVATVVAMLFNLIQPHRAYFGLKDYQQVQVIRQLVQALHFPVEICSLPTIREEDGLALSSRNRYLNPRQRRLAPALYRALLAGQSAWQKGERSGEALRKRILSSLQEIPELQIDYLEICDPHTLVSLEEVQEGALLALAARLGQTRLIDNLLLEEAPYGKNSA